MAKRMIRSPVRLCSRDGKICYDAYRRLEYDFLFLCLASFFFPYFFSSLFGYVSLLRIASSVQQPSAPRQQIRVYFLSYVFRLISEFFLLYLFYIFLYFLLFLVGVFVVLSYPVR